MPSNGEALQANFDNMLQQYVVDDARRSVYSDLDKGNAYIAALNGMHTGGVVDDTLGSSAALDYAQGTFYERGYAGVGAVILAAFDDLEGSEAWPIPFQT